MSSFTRITCRKGIFLIRDCLEEVLVEMNYSNQIKVVQNSDNTYSLEISKVSDNLRRDEILPILEKKMEEILPKMRLKSDSLRFNYDWVDALDVHDMLTALMLETQFCLFRKESRGAFYREDYPMTDNLNWLKHVVGYKGANGELILETLPVDLSYAQPEEGVADFFEVDY